MRDLHLRFASSSTTAAVLTVWPSGTSELPTVRSWLDAAAARIVHEQSVQLTSELAEMALVLALYDGEEWIESNCWYEEQPLPTGRPAGPYAGAKWKRDLCFRSSTNSRNPYVFVLDTGPSSSLWSDKYRVRSMLARDSGNPGNSCIHITDEQSAEILARRGVGLSSGGGGMACDLSYAFSCARVLLHPASIAWLNGPELAALELGSPAFRAAWRRYASWLASTAPDCSEEGEWVMPTSFEVEA